LLANVITSARLKPFQNVFLTIFGFVQEPFSVLLDIVHFIFSENRRTATLGCTLLWPFSQW